MFYKNITVYEYTVIYYIIHAVSKTQYYYPPLHSLHKSDFPISTKNTCCTREYAQSKSVVIEGVVACRRCTSRNTNEVRVCTTVTLNFLFQYTYYIWTRKSNIRLADSGVSKMWRKRFFLLIFTPRGFSILYVYVYTYDSFLSDLIMYISTIILTFKHVKLTSSWN